MDELQFEIKNKLTLKKETDIRAWCIQTKIIVNIRVPNYYKDNVVYIKNALIQEHNKIKERINNPPQQNGLRRGDII